MGGSIEELVQVRVRKDLAFQPDKDHAVGTFTVRLAGGQSTELRIEFVASEKSGSLLRRYFIEVDFLYLQQKWTMENSYSPRLRVEG